MHTLIVLKCLLNGLGTLSIDSIRSILDKMWARNFHCKWSEKLPERGILLATNRSRPSLSCFASRPDVATLIPSILSSTKSLFFLSGGTA